MMDTLISNVIIVVVVFFIGFFSSPFIGNSKQQTHKTNTPCDIVAGSLKALARVNHTIGFIFKIVVGQQKPIIDITLSDKRSPPHIHTAEAQQCFFYIFNNIAYWPHVRSSYNNNCVYLFRFSLEFTCFGVDSYRASHSKHTSPIFFTLQHNKVAKNNNTIEKSFLLLDSIKLSINVHYANIVIQLISRRIVELTASNSSHHRRHHHRLRHRRPLFFSATALFTLQTIYISNTFWNQRGNCVPLPLSVASDSMVIPVRCLGFGVDCSLENAFRYRKQFSPVAGKYGEGKKH